MRLTFTDDYDRWSEGQTADVEQPEVVSKLLGTFAVLPEDLSASDIRGEHNYQLLRAVADHLGVSDRTDDGKQLKKTDLKQRLIEEISDA